MNGPAARVSLRAYQRQDAPQLKALVASAWRQFAAQFSDWPALEAGLLQIERLAGQTELIVAEADGMVAGMVGYAGRGVPKADFFTPDWAVIRMLSVAPAMRGRGIGPMLTQACLSRAQAEQAPVTALHTSPVMASAESMYLKLGFVRERALPEVFGVPYYLYIKTN